MPTLAVNVDHVATLRQARGTRYPEPIQAALAAEHAGADSITLHLREDRRHIQDRDVAMLSDMLQTRMNLEMAVTDEMISIACDIRPRDVCLVPERREELTTEGGLDVAGQHARIEAACRTLSGTGMRVSLFIDADPAQLDAAVAVGAPVVEIHTGHYADAHNDRTRKVEYERIVKAVEYANQLGLQVNAEIRNAVRQARGSLDGGAVDAVLDERLFKRRIIEFRPKCISEEKFSVCNLPQQEVADSLLATGANKKIRLRQIYET